MNVRKEEREMGSYQVNQSSGSLIRRTGGDEVQRLNRGGGHFEAERIRGENERRGRMQTPETCTAWGRKKEEMTCTSQQQLSELAAKWL
jgi:hypothetical protein